MVSMLNSVSSYSVIVRPGQCLYTSPISNSSKHLPNCISASLSYHVGAWTCPALRNFHLESALQCHSERQRRISTLSTEILRSRSECQSQASLYLVPL